MKTVIIHGQNHVGSTCMISRELAKEVGGETSEFFLPRDFNEPCLGCYSYFKNDLKKCPHFEKIKGLTDAILESDLVILDSPVYVYHATGQMMSFLDHLGTWWVVHRPRPEMSRKQAVAVCTAAGGGMKETIKDMADSLEMWGIHKVYRLGLGIQATNHGEIPERIKGKIGKRVSRTAEKIKRNIGKIGYNARAKRWFSLIRFVHKHSTRSEPDYGYWEKMGWHGSLRPWTSLTSDKETTSCAR